MTEKIKELRDFYLLDGKLLYVSKEFIGFDPIISSGMSHERREGSGTKIKMESFEMDGCSFDVILIFFIDWGPLRGYKRTEILRSGRTIIDYEWGGMGHGSNYRKGNYFHLGEHDAFLLKNGWSTEDRIASKTYKDLIGDKDYLFWFKNVAIPTKSNAWPADGSALDHDRIYSLTEVEPLRQIEWEANVNFNNHNIYIKKTAVPYCWQTHWDSKKNIHEFRRNDNKGCNELGKVEFIIK